MSQRGGTGRGGGRGRGQGEVGGRQTGGSGKARSAHERSQGGKQRRWDGAYRATELVLTCWLALVNAGGRCVLTLATGLGRRVGDIRWRQGWRRVWAGGTCIASCGTDPLDAEDAAVEHSAVRPQSAVGVLLRGHVDKAVSAARVGLLVHDDRRAHDLYVGVGRGGSGGTGRRVGRAVGGRGRAQEGRAGEGERLGRKKPLVHTKRVRAGSALKRRDG